MTEIVEHVDEDIEEEHELARALKIGIGLGTPVTFAVFFAILSLSGIGLYRSLISAIWTALVGGAFYGGLTGMLHILNKHGH